MVRAKQTPHFVLAWHKVQRTVDMVSGQTLIAHGMVVNFLSICDVSIA